MRKEVARFTINYTQYLSPDGTVTSDIPEALTYDTDRLVVWYRDMVLTRVFDKKAIALQRQGQLGTFACSEGEEAVGVGYASAMSTVDIHIPHYRQTAALITFAEGDKKIDAMVRSLLFWLGDTRANDPLSLYHSLDFPPAIPIASQTLHASGAAGVCRYFMQGREKRVVVTTVGDGGTSKGDTYEAMNFAALWQAPIVFIITNNQWAISMPRTGQTAAETLAQKGIAAGIRHCEQVDGNDVLAVYTVVRAAIERARRGMGPSVIEAITYRLGAHTTADVPEHYRPKEEVEQARLNDPIRRLRAYLTGRGLWSENDEEKLQAESSELVEKAADRYLSTVRESPTTLFDYQMEKLPKSILAEREEVHALYGGKNLSTIRDSPRKQLASEASGVINIPIETIYGDPKGITMITALNQALVYEMSRDERVVLWGEDMGKSRGVFRATEGLLGRFGKTRVVDTPLAELGIMGAATGAAALGMRVVVEMQFSGFAYPIIDQLVNHTTRLRARTRGRLHCPIVVRMPWGGGVPAPEHHLESNEAFFTSIPGLRVLVPSSPQKAYGLLLAAIRDEDPVIFLEPISLYRGVKEVCTDQGDTLPLDTAFIVEESIDAKITFIAWGAMVYKALTVADLLREERGVESDVVDVASLVPLDMETIAASVRKTGRAVIIQEAPRHCGVGAEIAARLWEMIPEYLEAPIQRVTGWDITMPGFPMQHFHIPDERRIREAAERVLENEW
ncbi:MAG: thiamine pyrophosphate-dependent enzyme [bacterium]|nr:thiamine pyrophosphate-dependent enzyme [bacterium]MDZ4284210.1 thiamine pyrophosphate-dependent enzyme [Patescibacteria group bacterium]